MKLYIVIEGYAPEFESNDQNNLGIFSSEQKARDFISELLDYMPENYIENSENWWVVPDEYGDFTGEFIGIEELELDSWDALQDYKQEYNDSIYSNL